MHPRAAIDRHLAEGLPAAEAARLRVHLRGCAPCRDYHDRQVILLRALAGTPDDPTPAEYARLARYAATAPASAAAAVGAVTPAEPATALPSGPDRHAPPDRYAAPDRQPPPDRYAAPDRQPPPDRYAAPDRQPPPDRYAAPDRRPGLLDRLLWAPGWAVAGAAALIPLVVGILLWAGLAGQPVTVARIAEAHGLHVDDVGVDPGSRRVIREGQSLQVDGHGIAVLTLEGGGGTVRVFPGTRLSFAEGGRRLDLDRGRVWCIVTPNRGAFSVRTENAVAEVLGTSFVVQQRPDGTSEVRVIEGEVAVSDVSGRGRVSVRGGHRTVVGPDARPSAPARYDTQEDVSAWNRFLRDLMERLRGAVEGLRRMIEGR